MLGIVSAQLSISHHRSLQRTAERVPLVPCPLPPLLQYAAEDGSMLREVRVHGIYYQVWALSPLLPLVTALRKGSDPTCLPAAATATAAAAAATATLLPLLPLPPPLLLPPTDALPPSLPYRSP